MATCFGLQGSPPPSTPVCPRRTWGFMSAGDDDDDEDDEDDDDDEGNFRQPLG
jgi:hypothetical protein